MQSSDKPRGATSFLLVESLDSHFRWVTLPIMAPHKNVIIADIKRLPDIDQDFSDKPKPRVFHGANAKVVMKTPDGEELDIKGLSYDGFSYDEYPVQASAGALTLAAIDAAARQCRENFAEADKLIMSPADKTLLFDKFLVEEQISQDAFRIHLKARASNSSQPIMATASGWCRGCGGGQLNGSWPPCTCPKEAQIEATPKMGSGTLGSPATSSGVVQGDGFQVREKTPLERAMERVEPVSVMKGTPCYLCARRDAPLVRSKATGILVCLLCAEQHLGHLEA